jgi:hypothetical protein
MGNRKHIEYVPQCAFNSYSMHPMDLRGGRESTQVSILSNQKFSFLFYFCFTASAHLFFFLAQYVDGDFIIHFAGKKGSIKFNMVEHYLSKSEQLQSKLVAL